MTVSRQPNTQDDDIVAHLRQGILPLKYAYLGRAAHAHDALSNTSRYRAVAGRASLEAKALARAVGSARQLPAQWCEVGPGSGRHSVTLLRTLRRAGWCPERYLGLDLSTDLLAIAVGRLRESDIDVQAATWDFERAPTDEIERWRLSGAVLLTISGLTLGNVEYPVAALRHLRESTRTGDLIAITLATRRVDDRAPAAAYMSDDFRAAVLEPLLELGVRDGDGRLEFSFDGDESSIVGTFTFERDRRLLIEHSSVAFARGQSIRCFLSRRYTETGVRALLDDSGLESMLPSGDFLSSGGHQMLVLRR